MDRLPSGATSWAVSDCILRRRTTRTVQNSQRCERWSGDASNYHGSMPARKRLPPIHPGELLKDELREINVSLNELSSSLRVPMNRVSAIVIGKRAITVDPAMRLARYFGTSPQYWLNLQNAYDLETADRAEIEREVLPRTAA